MKKQLERRHHFFRNLKTSWLEGGNPHGPLLIFLHGYPDGPEVWEHQIEHFASRYHILCPYTRGTEFSESGDTLARYSLDSLCLDQLQLINHIDPTLQKPIILVGHDLGGALAWRLASYLAERLAKLIIINSLSLEQVLARILHRPKQLLYSWYIYPMLLPYVPELIATRFSKPLLQFAYRLGGLSPSKRPKILKGKKVAVDTINQYRAFARELPKLVQTTSARLKAPALILWGRKDPFLLPPTLDELEPYASNLSVRILDGSHWIFREKPEEVNRLLDTFFHGTKQAEAHAKHL